jgi:LmbE family N-acetylglucosaminyl deacetylase
MKKILKRRILLAASTLIIVFAFVFILLDQMVANYMVDTTPEHIDAPEAGSRVLIIAPHPDDETLGAGILIKETLANGGKVKVVLMTNGDGYRVAAHLDYTKLTLTPKEYINFGYTRQQESVKALASSGVSESDIIFLGYPDGGLASIWSSNWNSTSPYTSPYTQADRSPYTNSFKKNRLYCGQNVVADLSQIIHDFQPTDIVMPHPNDKHPDHWATNAFTKYTLTVLNYSPQKEWLYLIHRGLWPSPEAGSQSKRDLAPPAKLLKTGTKWYALDLTDQEIKLKTEAIKLYHSQQKTLGFQMSCFEKQSELFGQYTDAKLISGMRMDSDITPNAHNILIQDPVQDKLLLDVDKGGDILAVYAEISREGNLHLIIQTDQKMIKELNEYRYNLVFINKEKSSHLTLIVKGNEVYAQDPTTNTITRETANICVSNQGGMSHLIINQSAFQQLEFGHFDHVFMDAESAFNSHLIDKTAWRMIDTH